MKLSEYKIDCALHDLDAKKKELRKAKTSLSRVTRRLGHLTGSLHQTRETLQKVSNEVSLTGPRKINQLSAKVQLLRLEHETLLNEHAAANQHLEELVLCSVRNGQNASVLGSQKLDDSCEQTLHNFEMQAAKLQMSLHSAERLLAQYDIAAKASIEVAEQTIQMNTLLKSQKLIGTACEESTCELTRLSDKLSQYATTRDRLCHKQNILTSSKLSLLPIVARQVRLQQESKPQAAGSSRDAAIAHLTDGVSIFGSIAQLCRCKSAAAYVPLHLILQHDLSRDIVVQSRDGALVVGRFFATKRLGRITCRILDEMLEKRQRPQQWQWPGIRCILDDVECSGRFSPLFRKLLGSWYTCDCTATALEFLRKHPGFRGNLATQTGMLCYRGGREIRQFSCLEVESLFEKLSKSRNTIFLADAENVKTRHNVNDNIKEHTSNMDTLAQMQAEINEVNRLHQSCMKNLKMAQQRRAEHETAAQDVAESIQALATLMKNKTKLLFVRTENAEKEHFQNITRNDVSLRVKQLRAEHESVSQNLAKQRLNQASPTELQQNTCHELETALKICAFKLQDCQEQHKRVGASLRQSAARLETLKARS